MLLFSRAGYHSSFRGGGIPAPEAEKRGHPMRIRQRILSLLLAGALLVPGLPAAEAAWGGADLGGISATVRVDWPQTLEALRDPWRFA